MVSYINWNEIFPKNSLKVDFFKSPNYAESDFFQLVSIKIKITDEYQCILYFFKGKTTENDL